MEFYKNYDNFNKSFSSKRPNYKNLIDSMLNQFGTLAIPQAKLFISSFLEKEGLSKEVNNDSLVYAITSLCRTNRCHIEGPGEEVLVSLRDKELNSKTVDCLWVAYDYFKNQAKDDTFSYDQIFTCASPCSICRCTSNGPITFIEVDETTSSLLVMLQNNYNLYANNSENKKVNLGGYVIVVRDENALQSVSDLNLEMPHGIALISAGDTRYGYPKSIRYFGI